MTELVIRDVRPMGRDKCDILIEGGIIREIGPDVHAPDIPSVNGMGQIAMPGLVDAHTHLDKTLLGLGWYRNAVGTDLRAMIDNERQLRLDTSIDPHVQSMRHALALVANGTTRIRSHVDIDTEHGLKMLDGVIRTREALAGIVDIEIVAFPQSGLLIRPGTLGLLDMAMANGADVVGGLDPAGMDRDPKAHLDAIFELADRRGQPIDIHLHEPGELGAFSIELILERTRSLGMAGRVVISHAFCLAMLDYHRTSRLIDDLADLDVAIATTAAPSRDIPKVLRLLGAGIRVGAGCDGVRDSWNPLERPDMRDRARILAMRNNIRDDVGLEMVLSICTTGGAQMMGVEDHRLEPGCPADLIVVDAETLAEVVVTTSPISWVVKGGKITARNGKSERSAP